VSSLAITTIVARNYLAFARVLGHSLQKFHPEIPFYVLVADVGNNEGMDQNEPFQTLTLSDLDMGNHQSQLFCYGRKQFLVSLKPTLLHHFLNSGFTSALFLDPDMLLLCSLQKAFDQVAAHSLTLSPHIDTVATNASRRMREHALLLAGIYNGGFIGVSNTPETHRFLEWWESRLFSHCDDNLREGIHYDQRWLDLAPSFVEDVHIMRDPGINVAYWNLHDKDVTFKDGAIYINEFPCRLFHFSGFSPDNPTQVSVYRPDLKMAEVGVLGDLFASYAEMLYEVDHDQTKQLSWPWDVFTNGAKILPEYRNYYREMGGRAQRFGDPFDAQSKGSYYKWLKGPEYQLNNIKNHFKSYLRRLKRFALRMWKKFFLSRLKPRASKQSVPFTRPPGVHRHYLKLFNRKTPKP
jgi:hypothetical protein